MSPQITVDESVVSTDPRIYRVKFNPQGMNLCLKYRRIFTGYVNRGNIRGEYQVFGMWR